MSTYRRRSGRSAGNDDACGPVRSKASGALVGTFVIKRTVTELIANCVMYTPSRKWPGNYTYQGHQSVVRL